MTKNGNFRYLLHCNYEVDDFVFFSCKNFAYTIQKRSQKYKVCCIITPKTCPLCTAQIMEMECATSWLNSSRVCDGRFLFDHRLAGARSRCVKNLVLHKDDQQKMNSLGFSSRPAHIHKVTLPTTSKRQQKKFVYMQGRIIQAHRKKKLLQRLTCPRRFFHVAHLYTPCRILDQPCSLLLFSTRKN